MADPLSVTAGIIAVLQLLQTTISYLKGIKDGSADRHQLRLETRNTIHLLEILKDHVEDAESGEAWCASIRSLNTRDGPLDQLKKALEHLIAKLAPAGGRLVQFKTSMKWPFSKTEVLEFLNTIERQKALFNLALQNDHIKLSQGIRNEVQEISNKFTELKVGQAREEANREDRDILAWLSALDFHAKQSDVLSGKQEDTGDWFFETDAYREWEEGVERILWCPGIPGAGKTVLASAVINHLQYTFINCEVGVAFVYCNYKEQEQTTANLLASLLQQLIYRQHTIPDRVRELYARYQAQGTRPTLAEYSRLLQLTTDGFTRCFIIVDALDECSESNGTRTSFVSEIRKLPQATQLCTSRQLRDIERIFESDRRLHIRATTADIRKYSYSRTETETRLHRHVAGDSVLRDTILDTIVSRADGMFLLAKLHLDSLAEKHSRRDVRRALASLPKTLDQTYDEALRRIRSQNENDVLLAESVLSWICFAVRPLSVEEIQHAIACANEESVETAFDEEGLPDEDLLIAVCAGIVTIEENGKIIRLVHYTTQEYFERVRHVEFPTAQNDITLACLTYLSYRDFAEGACEGHAVDDRIQKYSLLQYAAQNWATHAQGQVEQKLQNEILHFLLRNGAVQCAFQAQDVWYSRGRNVWCSRAQFNVDIPSIVYVAFFGLDGAVGSLLKIGMQVDECDRYKRTALSVAAEGGHEAVVKLLLEREDIHADSQDKEGRTPLSHAARRGNEAIVKLLVERKDVNADSKDMWNRTPLSNAVSGGYDEVVRLLLERDIVNVNSKVCDDEMVLSIAVRLGHDKVVKELLKRDGIEADSKDSKGRTPLWYAADKGDEKITKLLVERADVVVDSKDMDGRTLLWYAARKEHVAVVKLLLAQGKSDADSKDNGEWSPLSCAAYEEHAAILNLLAARKDVKADSKDMCGRTPLSQAAQRGHVGVVNLLLDREDVTADSKDEKNWTPLSYAACGGHEPVVKLLAERNDVKVNCKDKDGRTPLSLAAQHGKVGAVKLLLEREDIAVNSKDTWGRTPLSWAAENWSETAEIIMKLLLERDDVDANTHDKNGRTPLSLAATNNYRRAKKLVPLLLERKDINVDLHDKNGRTPLSWAAGNSDYDAYHIVELLLKRDDVNLDSKDEDGWTPLMWAAAAGNSATVEALCVAPWRT